MSALFRIPALRNAYLLRGFLVWGALRLALAVGGVSDANVLVETGLLLAVATAVLLDARRRGEGLFLGNLGIPAIAIALCSVPAALLAECLFP